MPVEDNIEDESFLANSFLWCWHEIDQFPLLSPEEEIELAQRVGDGDEEAVRKMVNCNLRLVVSIARRCQHYAGPSLAITDLVQEGVIGLIKAVHKFDHRLGYRFSTYATCWIRQAIMRAISDTGRTIRLPVHVVENIQRVEKARVTLTQTLEREPAHGEVANHVGLPLHRVLSLNEQSQDSWSLQMLLSNESSAMPLEDYLEDIDAPSPLEWATDSVDRKQICAAVREAIKQLPERQAKVLQWRFGLDGEERLTLGEVAKRMRVSRERVRQLQRQACDQLRLSVELRQLFEAEA